MISRFPLLMLAILFLVPGCARMDARVKERREGRAIAQIERRMAVYHEAVLKLPADPGIGVPVLETFYEPDQLTPHLLRRDYEIIRGVSEHIVAAAIYNLKLSETGNDAVATVRFVRNQSSGGQQFGSFNSEWKRVRGKWYLGLDNFWSDSDGDNYITYSDFHSSFSAGELH